MQLYMKYGFLITACELVLAIVPACEPQPTYRLRATPFAREPQDGEHRVLGETHARQQVR
jgi:hypothetical protein